MRSSTVFEILGHFLFQEGMRPPRMLMIYIHVPSDVPCHKEQEYVWFRGRDFNGF
jgi:hypothetical protein